MTTFELGALEAAIGMPPTTNPREVPAWRRETTSIIVIKSNNWMAVFPVRSYIYTIRARVHAGVCCGERFRRQSYGPIVGGISGQ